MRVSGWQTHRLRGRPDRGQTHRSCEEEEQGGRVSQTLPGGVTGGGIPPRGGFIAAGVLKTN